MNNSRVYTADNAGKRYLYENGKKRELGPNDPGDFQAKGARTEPTYGAWTSASGTRKVTYTRDGSLTLHDGTSFYPLAFKKESDRLVWIIASSAGVEKCTYKTIAVFLVALLARALSGSTALAQDYQKIFEKEWIES